MVLASEPVGRISRATELPCYYSQIPFFIWYTNNVFILKQNIHIFIYKDKDQRNVIETHIVAVYVEDQGLHVLWHIPTNAINT